MRTQRYGLQEFEPAVIESRSETISRLLSRCAPRNDGKMARPIGLAAARRPACRLAALASVPTFALRAIQIEPRTQAKLKRPLKEPFEFGAHDRISGR